MKSIGELQAEIEAALARVGSVALPEELGALRNLIPSGFSPRVSLRNAQGNRQIKRTADSSNFNPETCVATVSYEPDSHDPVAEESGVDQRLADVIMSLHDAERDARFRDFVGLKPFRDQYLIQRGYGWAEIQQDRQHVLAQAIEEKLVLTGKVPNPKSPDHPVTSIRLNRGHAKVESLLKSTQDQRSLFRPVQIRGDGLSTTVIKERR